MTACVVINSTIKIGTNNAFYINSYFDPTSVVLQIGTAILPSQFVCNNVQGVIQFSGINYAIQDQFVGTPQANGYAVGVQWLTEANLTANGYAGTIAGWDFAASTCINRDPLFVDAPNGNYYNSRTSPHLFRGNAGYNPIGLSAPLDSFKNSDNGDGRGTVVIPSAQIDTTDPDNFKLLSGQTEGYVDYIVPCYGKRLVGVKVRSLLEFNSSVTPGTTGNQLVPDSQPLTSEYPSVTLATATAADTTHIVVAQGVISVGQWILCGARQVQVLSKVNSAPNDILAVSGPMVVVITAGIAVTYANSQSSLAALVPNRLTYKMRTKTSAAPPTVPMIDAEWDNGLDPGLGFTGSFVNNEIVNTPNFPVPGLIVGNGVLYGVSDADAPVIVPRAVAPQWLNVRVYIRNNYKSIGQ
jgi:hypothetical protein